MVFVFQTLCSCIVKVLSCLAKVGWLSRSSHLFEQLLHCLDIPFNVFVLIKIIQSIVIKLCMLVRINTWLSNNAIGFCIKILYVVDIFFILNVSFFSIVFCKSIVCFNNIESWCLAKSFGPLVDIAVNLVLFIIFAFKSENDAIVVGINKLFGILCCHIVVVYLLNSSHPLICFDTILRLQETGSLKK